MSFRRTSNQTDHWRTYCEKHSQYVDQLSRLAALFNSPQRFDEFLQTGVFSNSNEILTISSLSEEEWTPFELFVDCYSNEWETYFTPTMYRGYYDERGRRYWRPSTTEFKTSDLSSQWLAIHFWASWNAHDRTMDSNLMAIVPRFLNVAFRSIDVDRQDLRQICTDADVLNVPALALYYNGNRTSTIIGVRSPDDIAHEIQTWMDTTNAR